MTLGLNGPKRTSKLTNFGDAKSFPLTTRRMPRPRRRESPREPSRDMSPTRLRGSNPPPQDEAMIALLQAERELQHDEWLVSRMAAAIQERQHRLNRQLAACVQSANSSTPRKPPHTRPTSHRTPPGRHGRPEE